MNQEFILPELKIISFENDDVIRTSNGGPGGGYGSETGDEWED